MEFRIEHDPIDVAPMMEPDPKWKHVCECGFTHRWHSEDKEFQERPGMCKVELPTLNYVIDAESSEDYPEIGHYECIGCKREITPKKRSPLYRYQINGQSRFYIDDKRVSEQEFMKIAKKKYNAS